jgi:tRNA-Thr(GGU) m(6)t(6)A37 methyltransferase TsaA
MTIEPIAHIRTDFSDKFGIPRQSGRVASLQGRIIFEPSFRNPDALREIEGFSHLWLIFDFSLAHRDGWSATVRPPRLGGNTRVGVFATRSPFRPNPIGLSSVKLESVEFDPALGPVLNVLGADLMDGTPIFDIKPYLPYTDCHADASGGFTDSTEMPELELDFPENLLRLVPEESREGLIGVLRQDPRPRYKSDGDREYGFEFAGLEVKFTVTEGVVRVISVQSK